MTQAQQHEDLMRRIMGEVTEKLTTDLREVLAAALEKQLSTALTQSLLESKFYRRISGDMRNGLKKIYKEINAAAQNPPQDGQKAASEKVRADRLFHEASEQLSAVLQQTEKATEDIMEILERHMDTRAKSGQLLQQLREEGASEDVVKDLESMNNQLGEDLNNIMLSLSFQDLTGQRIKLAVSALKEIESTVVEMYLSTGLLIQAYEETPHRGIDEIETETRQKVSELKTSSVLSSSLKGPDSSSSQKNIDDLLAQLGM